MFSAGVQGKGQARGSFDKSVQSNATYKKKRPGELNCTFEGDNDDFLLPVAAPLLELSEGVDEDAGVDDDDVRVFLLDAAFARVEILSSTLPRTSTDRHWTFFLVSLIRLIIGSRSSKPDTADGELATLGVS